MILVISIFIFVFWLMKGGVFLWMFSEVDVEIGSYLLIGSLITFMIRSRVARLIGIWIGLFVLFMVWFFIKFLVVFIVIVWIVFFLRCWVILSIRRMLCFLILRVERIGGSWLLNWIFMIVLIIWVILLVLMDFVEVYVCVMRELVVCKVRFLVLFKFVLVLGIFVMFIDFIVLLCVMC